MTEITSAPASSKAINCYQTKEIYDSVFHPDGQEYDRRDYDFIVGNFCFNNTYGNDSVNFHKHRAGEIDPNQWSIVLSAEEMVASIQKNYAEFFDACMKKAWSGVTKEVSNKKITSQTISFKDFPLNGHDCSENIVSDDNLLTIDILDGIVAGEEAPERVSSYLLKKWGNYPNREGYTPAHVLLKWQLALGADMEEVVPNSRYVKKWLSHLEVAGVKFNQRTDLPSTRKLLEELRKDHELFFKNCGNLEQIYSFIPNTTQKKTRLQK